MPEIIYAVKIKYNVSGMCKFISLKFRKNYIAFFIIFLLFLMNSTFSSAKQVTKNESLEIARQFYLSHCISKETNLKSAKALDFKLDYINTDSDKALKSASTANKAQVAYYYVYNVGDNQGFVIVSGDDRTTPVLGYSYQGKFASASMPEHVRVFMDNYKAQVKAVMQNPENVAIQKSSASVTDTTAVLPLLTTRWGQYAPFWNKIPVEAPTGCVATAMAQVMNYFKWPAKGTSSYSYTYNGNKFSANFGNTTYDWANMSDMYYSNDDTSLVQCKAVATLMYHCGVSLNMQYTPDASGASTSNVPFALKNFFGYDKNVRYITSDNYTPNQFKYQVMLEIKSGRPVIIAGHDDQLGHSYIADGYDSYNFIHLNWGWYGDYNGFYEMNPIDASTYWIPHGIVIGIQKPVNTSDLALVYQGFNLTYNTSLSKTQPITTTIKISEENNKSFNGEVALALYKNEMLYKVINTISSTINSGSTQTKSFNISIPDTLSVGTYRLVPLFKSATDEKWSEMKYKNATLTTDTRTNENIEFVISNNDLTIYQNSKTMDCKKGDFRTKFLYADWENVQRLVVTGDIDQWDLMYMAGTKNIKSIDISKASIIETKLDTSKLEYGGLPSDFYKFTDNLSSKLKNIADRFWNVGIYFNPTNHSDWTEIVNGIYYCNEYCYAQNKSFLFSFDEYYPNGLLYNSNNKTYIYSRTGWYDQPNFLEDQLRQGKAFKILQEMQSDAPEFSPYISKASETLIEKKESSTQLEVKCNFIIGKDGLMAEVFNNSIVENIILPQSLRYIAPKSFSNCSKLKTIVLPDSIELIGDSVIYNCSDLTELKLSKKINILGLQAFNSLNKLKEINLPNELIEIKDKCFMGCMNLTSINMPETLKKIGKGAFSGCSGLTTMTIPASVDTIQSEAFLNCTGLTAIYAHRKIPVTLEASPNVFFSSNKSATTCTLYVPEGSKSAYQKASQWKDFYNIVEIPNFTLSPSSANITANSGNYSDLAKVSISSKWTANSNQTWLKLTTESGSGNGQIEFTVTANPTIQPRVAIITVTAEGFASQAISITQAAGAVKLLVSSNEISLGSVADSTQTVGIISNTFWTASSDQSWLTISPQSGVYGETIRLSAEANTTTDQRIARIVVTATGTKDQVIVVTQEPGSKTINVNAGELASKLSTTEKANVTHLILNGIIDARDFKVMRDEMPLLTVVDMSNVSITNYTGGFGTLSSLNTYPANTIPECAFCSESLDNGKASLTTVVFPSNLKRIDRYAFLKCSGLTGKLNLPSSVTYVGRSAFNSCKFTGNLNLPSSLETIGRCAFYNCPGFTGDLIIPSKVDTIGDYAFAYCSGFDGSLNISNSVTTILESAFDQCSGFTGGLTIPSSVKTIGDWAFDECTGFDGSLKIGNSVKSIGIAAFQDCSGFKGELIIPDSVDSIKKYAFAVCNGFTGSLIFPSSVKYIGEYSFNGCDGITGLTLPFTITTITEGCFEYCTSLSGSLNIPSGVETINDYAFDGCSGFNGTLSLSNNLKNIGLAAFQNCNGFTGILNIPSAVDSIKPFAFSQCSTFNKLTIPISVGYIGSVAFQSCTGLTAIYAYATTPLDLTGVYWVFNNIDKLNCTLYVPIGSKADYQIADQWKDFYNIEEMNTTGIEKELYSTSNVYTKNNSIIVQLSQDEQDANVSVYDLSGRLIKSQKMSTSRTTIPMNDHGVYLVCVGVGSQMHTEKVVIQ